jgi:hypothetical protein
MVPPWPRWSGQTFIRLANLCLGEQTLDPLEWPLRAGRACSPISCGVPIARFGMEVN